MEQKKTIIPGEIDFLGVHPFWGVKKIQFSTVIALVDLNSGIYRLFFAILKD
jgi:hypothetical protein